MRVYKSGENRYGGTPIERTERKLHRYRKERSDLFIFSLREKMTSSRKSWKIFHFPRKEKWPRNKGLNVWVFCEFLFIHFIQHFFMRLFIKFIQINPEKECIIIVRYQNTATVLIIVLALTFLTQTFSNIQLRIMYGVTNMSHSFVMWVKRPREVRHI